MKTYEASFGSTEVYAMIPEGGSRKVVYLLEPLKNMPGLEDYVTDGKCNIVSVFGMDWEKDLTPWKAPKVLKRGGDFLGGAPEFLSHLENSLIPEVEKECLPEGTEAERYLVGISLAGLFALWASLQDSTFSGGIASVSGSLWFDGFSDYLKGKEFPFPVEKVYLSVGEAEKNTRNPRMAVVEERTREAASIIEGRGIRTKFELNPGNHFSDTVPRLRKAVDFLIGQ